jgi:hypothetical protein
MVREMFNRSSLTPDHAPASGADDAVWVSRKAMITVTAMKVVPPRR